MIKRVIFGLFLVINPVFGQISTNQVNKIVDSIYIIEGGAKTKYLYGIKSIKTSNPRQVCYNTVLNNTIRYQNQTKYTNYFIFLADRYCPPISDKQGNLNWRKNIQSILGQQFVDKFNKELTSHKL